MLHIHNGDAAANVAKLSTIPGEHFAFREALISGPTPAELEENDWRLVRARHLWEGYGVDLKQVGDDLRQQEEKLASGREHDEVVLWFEHDLFCQLHLIYLLDWFGRHAMGNAKLSLVCIGDFPGRENFRGLGELTPQEFSSLFPARQPVTNIQLKLATAAWRAYCSPEPTNIEILLQSDTSSLPFLNAALRAHLERFPSVRNGLGRIENRALQLVQKGHSRFSDLFSRFGEAEAVYGVGDSQLWHSLRQMGVTTRPLITIRGETNEEIDTKVLTSDVVRNAKLQITALGETVLNGDADAVKLNRVETWLGGMHLSGRKNLWRWDEGTESLSFFPRPR